MENSTVEVLLLQTLIFVIRVNLHADQTIISRVLVLASNVLFYVLQKYHLNHHFRIQNKGFGITSSLWDMVFGTLPQTKAFNNSI